MRLQSADESLCLDDDLVVVGDNAPVLVALPDRPSTSSTWTRRSIRPGSGAAHADRDRGRRRRPARLPGPAVQLDAVAHAQLRRPVRGLPRVSGTAPVRARELLAPHGTLYFHIDYREAHYCKLLLDEVFGRDAFLNELIWAYDYGAKPRRRWPAKHDTILVYVRTPGAHHFDADAVDREPYMAPGLVSAEKAARGKRPTDVWFHTIVPTNGREKTGYPTQKPEGVLRRLVAASSRPGGWCLDPFAGSGTLGAVCRQLGRRFVLIDENPVAAEVMRDRLDGRGRCAQPSSSPGTSGTNLTASSRVRSIR